MSALSRSCNCELVNVVNKDDTFAGTDGVGLGADCAGKVPLLTTKGDPVPVEVPLIVILAVAVKLPCDPLGFGYCPTMKLDGT